MYWPATFADMPMLRELAYTPLQFDQFAQWQASDKHPAPRKVVDEDVRSFNIFDQIVSTGLRAAFETAADADAAFDALLAARPRFAPALIDMAHLGAMLGGSFLPGIEVGREAGIAKNWTMFHGGSPWFPDVRFKPCDVEAEHPLGTLTKDLAVPWSEDFYHCDENFWPTACPGIMFHNDTVNDYWLLFPQTDADPANHIEAFAGNIIEHLGRPATGGEYLREYWKSLRFIRRRADDKFIVAE
jgi:hypothetical protein